MTNSFTSFLLLVAGVMLTIGFPYYLEFLVRLAARAWFNEKLRNHHAMIAQTLGRKPHG